MKQISLRFYIVKHSVTVRFHDALDFRVSLTFTTSKFVPGPPLDSQVSIMLPFVMATGFFPTSDLCINTGLSSQTLPHYRPHWSP